ncbi:MAG: cation diffusion facilitator family transporter [Pseudomonadota bacterium]
MTTDQQHRYQQIKRVTVIGIIVNSLLAIAKISIGFIGHSQALVADGVHSFSDVITDTMVMLAAKASNQSPDQDHPYGHGRIETLATMLMAIVLVIIGVIIAYQGVFDIIHSDYVMPDVMVIIMAAISVLANELLFQITNAVGKRVNSSLLCSNAWHNRIDALSSLVVLIGAIGAKFSYLWLDSVAAIIIAILIIKMGIKLAWPSAKELVDTGLSLEETEKIREKIKCVAGVKSIHQLRTRSLGNTVFTDVHIQVEARLSVSEGHYIADQVYAALVHSGFDISDVLVHIDAEDDEHILSSKYLPNRAQIIADLQAQCHHLGLPQHWENVQLHYLGGKIYVDLFFPLSILEHQDPKNLRADYKKVTDTIDYLGEIRLYFSDSQ